MAEIAWTVEDVAHGQSIAKQTNLLALKAAVDVVTERGERRRVAVG